jgi:hypothetical protein
MKFQILKICIKKIFKSFIWLILPLSIYGDIQSCSSFKEAGEHLTPYSVSVRGYYRRNGTYVSSYNRRPPGSVSHDAPYKEKRFNMGLLFIICLSSGIGSIFLYRFLIIIDLDKIEQKRINEQTELIKNKREEEKILKIEKENIKKLEEEKKEKLFEFEMKVLREKEKIQQIENDKVWSNKIQNYILITLEKINESENFFKELSQLPNNLFISQQFIKCKFCKTQIKPKEFYISFKAIKHFHFVCPLCVESYERIGINQPSNDFIQSKSFIKNFNIKKSKFINKFSEISNELKLTEIQIEEIFYSEIKTKKENQI